MKKITLIAALALAFASSGASANTLTFQGVTFSTATTSTAGELVLTISNALTAGQNPTAGSDWGGINYLESFSLGSVGTFTSASLSGWSYLAGGLSNGNSGAGCDGNGANTACFYQPATPVTLTNSMVFDIFFTGGISDFSAPHLKVDFWAYDPNQAGCDISVTAGNASCNATGSLLSQDIPAGDTPVVTPLPAALPLFATGLVGLGLLGWRKKRKAAAAVAA